ncbi:RNA polymerase sigma factor [Oricola cellulosilytica]|uniref:RNA polymerase sigma factor n=1 Tax=Oricola cellulosilytica TaxID=1429082 RepID=A0A4V2MN36_9HYPH|nr:RNA polymerase sigma factor [Oricola cellulosilytica]TCD11347.1 RNA polymerase sigma factor [Oricola cellulosilytica]
MSRFEQELLSVLPQLRRYARSLSRNSEEAEDLVQDCVERAFSKRVTWRGVNLRAWLMTILTNLNRDRIGAQGRTPDLISMDEAGEPAVSEVEADPLERDRLAAALDRLGADQRAVLMLIVVEGYRYAEVAAMLEIPIGTVMSRLSRARRNLARSLETDNIVEFRRSR